MKAGQTFSASIRGIDTEGLIQIQNGGVYLCQNQLDGSSCLNKLGYIYSYYIGNGKSSIFHNVENLKLDVKIIKPKTIKSKKMLTTYAGYSINRKYAPGFKSLLKLKEAAGNRRNLKDLLKISPDTYLKIAG